MAHEELALWKCDRCGKEARAPREMKPDGAPWWHMQGTALVNNGADAAFSHWELCPGCYAQTTRLLEPTSAPNGSRTEEVA